MATDKKIEDEEDPMAAWAEALEEQKVAEAKPEDTSQGGPLFGNGPMSKDKDGGGSQDINMVLDIPVTLSVELGRTKVSIKHILQLGDRKSVV